MGNAKIRRLCKQESKWIDKSANKHKHDFCEHYLAEVKDNNDFISYYDVMKCAYCNSFKSISREGSVRGLVFEKELTDDLLVLPRLHFKTNSTLLSFSKIELDTIAKDKNRY